MADFPPKKNIAFTFYVPGLVSQANTKIFQASPTIAAGDFTVFNGTIYVNLTALPDVFPAAGTQVRVQLSISEMNQDVVMVRWIDAAGAEWCDGGAEILTVTNQMADVALASVATEARLARLDENVSAAKTLATGAITTTVIATGAIDADALATDAVAEIADAVWDEAVSGHTTATTFGGKLQNSVSTAASIADAVLEELVTDHSSVANSVAEALKIVRAMVLGKYTLSGSTFTIYAEDGTTVLKQFTVTSTDRTPL